MPDAFHAEGFSIVLHHSATVVLTLSCYHFLFICSVLKFLSGMIILLNLTGARPAYTRKLRIYWGLRLASRMYGRILVIIIDGMDKAKFAWPRWPWRVNHEIAALIRPRMTFTAVMAHGWCCSLYHAPEWLVSGANYCIDLLCRTIVQVWDISQRTGRPFPRHLVVQSDNTVSQSKNETVCLWLAWLVAASLFESANLFFLRVGHTHEDIDQLFGVIATLIIKCHTYETPEQLMKYLAKSLTPKFAAKNELLTSEMVTAVRRSSRKHVALLLIPSASQGCAEQHWTCQARFVKPQGCKHYSLS